jgi:tetratricopeptide (TPR) repeat protein
MMMLKMPHAMPYPLLLALLAMSLPPRALRAQEFTQQTMLVVPFRADSTPGLLDEAHKVSDGVRNRLGKLIPEREVEVLSNARLNALLIKSNYRRNSQISDVETRLAASELRADEIVFGRVQREGRAVVVHARLARIRGWNMQQPLPVVRAATADAAADLVAGEVLKARTQLTGLRRCENALAKSDLATAARSAEQAIRTYPRAVIARDCLIAALRDGTTGADSLLRVANEALALDSNNTFAEVARAQSLEALKRSREAVDQWNRLYTQHYDSLTLGVSVVEALLRLQQPRTALDDARALEKRFGDKPELRRLRFRAFSQLQQHAQAAHLGDSLELEDPTFRADSAYTVRHIEALRQAGDTLGALEMGVRAVRRFPGDARLYLQYLQLMGTEQTVALPRGLARFPDVPELRLLAAREARRTGNRRVAIRETAAAIARDSSLVTPFLSLADLHLEDDRADSALLVLSRAPRTGDQKETVRSYVLARGLQQLRAAADTAPARQRLALQLLLLADSVESREDSRATVTAASLQVARSHLVDAFRTNACADVQQADTMLGLSAQVIARGLGSGGNIAEINAAYDAMRKATTDALAARCKGGGIVRAPS